MSEPARKEEPTQFRAFRTWLESNGAVIHPSVYFEVGDNGASVHTSTELASDTIVASAPFSLAITAPLATESISKLLSPEGKQVALAGWTERQLVISYVVLHWVVDQPEKGPPELKHYPYLATLPAPSTLRTPLQFRQVEFHLLKATNLFGAANDRISDWKDEWKACKTVVEKCNEGWGRGFTWERYLAASTYLASRAFPSSVLSDPPSLSEPNSHAILLPLIDSLNHGRAQPVTWETSQSESGRQISLKLHNSFTAGAELLNNYGAKPNSELLLGYGFVIQDNPDDTIVLQLGGGKKWEIGRDAKGIEGLWEEIKVFVLDGEDEEFEGEGILAGAQVLGELIVDKLQRMDSIDGWDDPAVRPDVRKMIEVYSAGQRGILQAILEFANAEGAKIESTLEKFDSDIDSSAEGEL